MATEVLTETPGNIWKILVEAGAQVEAGQTLFIMEIMKTEVAHVAPVAGKVASINIAEGQNDVDVDVVAMTIE